MTAIFLGPRFIRSAHRLDRRLKSKTEAALQNTAQWFGDPHRHHGLGLRKLASRTWECRIDIRWRIIFIEEETGLRAYDIMDHDEVRAWLKGR